MGKSVEVFQKLRDCCILCELKIGKIPIIPVPVYENLSIKVSEKIGKIPIGAVYEDLSIKVSEKIGKIPIVAVYEDRSRKVSETVRHYSESIKMHIGAISIF